MVKVLVKSCLTNVLVVVITVSGDRVCSWAAAVVVDRCCATCPWEMLSNREFNKLLSQRGMCIPIALCSIAIVAAVWPAVGFCFPAKTLFSPAVGGDICKPSYIRLRLTRCVFHSSRRCTRNMSSQAILIVSIGLLRFLRVCFGHPQSQSTLAPGLRGQRLVCTRTTRKQYRVISSV